MRLAAKDGGGRNIGLTIDLMGRDHRDDLPLFLEGRNCWLVNNQKSI